MTLGPEDISTATFRTTQGADTICKELTSKLGWRHRYVAARLAIARSLSLSDLPPRLGESDYENMATPIRGVQLFGEAVDCGVWLALLAQHSNQYDLKKKDFQALVTSHWKRGAELLHRDWEETGGTLAEFVARLAELASFSTDGEYQPDGVDDSDVPILARELRIAVGEEALDTKTNEKVYFPLNGAGGSPHMAIMGGVGSGKTRTAVHMLTELSNQGSVPLLAFDFKGDLSERLGPAFNAEVLRPPENPIPLDVLYVGSNEENALKSAAGRIRDSIASVKTRSISGIQKESLREAVLATLRATTRGMEIDLSSVAEALEDEYEERGRRPDELSATLNELTQFSLFRPSMSPKEFFSKSWVIQLPQDGSAEMRRLIINMTLDALDRWLNSQPDAPMDENGVRALRHVTMLDEAHVILATKLPALGNLVRMSRSKGGVVMLVSQSPDDFEGAEDGYLDNMGLTLAFNTQAKLGPTKRIFGENVSISGLQIGEAFCRVRSEAKTRKIVSWRTN